MHTFFSGLFSTQMKNHSRNLFFLGFSLLLLLISCGEEPGGPLVTFSVSEPAGLQREIEYIEIGVPVESRYDISNGFLIREIGKTNDIQGQIIASRELSSDSISYTCLFPVSLEAHGKRTFEVHRGTGSLPDAHLKISGTGTNLQVENVFYQAVLTDKKATEENGLGSGQLAGLVLNDFKGQLLERSHINMHWAPNFQKESLDYRTFGHIKNPDSLLVIKGPYLLSLYKSGKVPDYPEIDVRYHYRFYGGLPYFLFTSEMNFNSDVELMLLRNDEMTMDSLFTHVMFSEPGGKVKTIELYDEEAMKKLEEDPIRDDAAWLCFYNEEAKYAFASIRLKYDNTNARGDKSPLYEPHTKITSSANNGRYWNRRLIHDHNTVVPEGSRYSEMNAYLLFRLNPDDPVSPIHDCLKQLVNPVRVDYNE